MAVPRRRIGHGKERKPAGPRLSWCAVEFAPPGCSRADVCARECFSSEYRRRHPHPELEPDPRLVLANEPPPEYYAALARAQPRTKGVQP